MKGININCKEYPFCQWIKEGVKTVETRFTPSLRPYLDQIVGIVQTGTGKAKLIGYAKITEEIKYNYCSFCDDIARHCISYDMESYFLNKSDGTKYGYVLEFIKAINPIEINTRGIVARQIPEMI